VRPFVKWIGGKQRLLPTMLTHLPADLEQRNYAEPFLGGGSLLLAIANRVPQATVSDTNLELIRTWDAVQRDADGLADELGILCQNTNREAFELARAEFNQLMEVDPLRTEPEIRVAALFIYLNKVGFNGLYRVNKSGKCNVPYGKAEKPASAIFSRGHLFDIGELLSNTHISYMPYQMALGVVPEPGFVYLDPPFPPASKTAHFTAYTPEKFGDIDQLKLATDIRQMAQRDIKFMLSMPDQPFVRELYRGYVFHQVTGTRSGSATPKGRGKVGELLITNY